MITKSGEADEAPEKDSFKANTKRNFDKLFARQLALQKDMTRLTEAVARRLRKFSDKIRTYDETNLLAMEARHDDLSRRFRLLIDKVTVVTEAAYFVRHQETSDAVRGRLLGALIFSLDQPDEWWIDHLGRKPKKPTKRNPLFDKDAEAEDADDDDDGALSVKEWVKVCFDAYRESKLNAMTQDKVSLRLQEKTQ